MALTQQQIDELNAAYKRVQAGTPGQATATNAGDLANIEYAKKQGWTPSDSSSLKGTMEQPSERSLPNTSSPITGFKSALQEATRIAYGNKPTSDILGTYKAAGMSMTNPDLMQYAISSDTEQRAGRLIDLYNNTMSAIEEQEKTRQQATKYGQDILANMMQTSFAKQITGADYESIMRGEMPTELITKWGEYLQSAEAQDEVNKKQFVPQTENQPGGSFDPITGIFTAFDAGSLPDIGVQISTPLGVGKITAYGSDAWEYGLDFGVSGGLNAPVGSPISGTIIDVKPNGGFGNQVKIDIGNGEQLWLSHFNTINKKVGDVVNVGDIVGLQGSTGTSTGPHVDVTIKKADGSFYTAREVAGRLGMATDSRTNKQKDMDLIMNDIEAIRGSDGKLDPTKFPLIKSKVPPELQAWFDKAGFEDQLGTGKGSILSEDFLAMQYKSSPEVKKMFDEATYKKSKGFWKNDKPYDEWYIDQVNEYVKNDIMPIVEQYRKAGYSDEEILKMMQ